MNPPASHRHLPLTSRSLADTLAHRFGPDITRAVMKALVLGDADRAVDLCVVERAIAMALDAELVVAGASFTAQACVSALANSPAFQRAAQQAGVAIDRLDAEQRLHIDAAFSRRWRTLDIRKAPARELELAQSVMAAGPARRVLLTKRWGWNPARDAVTNDQDAAGAAQPS